MSDRLNIQSIRIRYLRTYSSSGASESTTATFIHLQIYLPFSQSDALEITQIVNFKIKERFFIQII